MLYGPSGVVQTKMETEKNIEILETEKVCYAALLGNVTRVGAIYLSSYLVGNTVANKFILGNDI